MSGLFGLGDTTQQTGSPRDGAPQPAKGLAQFNPNMAAPANYWQGNQLQIPGAQGLGNGIVNPAAAPQPTAGGIPQPGQQQKPQWWQQLLGSGLFGLAPAMMGQQGGLAGALGGTGARQAMPGGGAPASMSPVPAPGMAQAMGSMGGGGNPGIQQLLQMLQQRQGQ